MLKEILPVCKDLFLTVLVPGNYGAGWRWHHPLSSPVDFMLKEMLPVRKDLFLGVRYLYLKTMVQAGVDIILCPAQVNLC